METTPKPIDSVLARKLARAYSAADRGASFGPSFFVRQLGALVRASCPTAQERVGIVELHLLGGEVLEVCHIISLTPAWVALAVFDELRQGDGGQSMRTELVPYGCIARVTISSQVRSTGRIGFGQDHQPDLSLQQSIPAERLLELAAAPAT